MACARGRDGRLSGVILIEPLLDQAGSEVVARLDATGPEVLPELLAALPTGKRTRLEAHRPWVREYLFHRPDWRPTGINFYTFALHPTRPLPPADPNLVRLTARHVASGVTRQINWAPSTLRAHLNEGGHAFAVEREGRLVARAVTDMATPYTEEIASVYTVPAFRGHGLAKAVVAAAAADIRSRGRIPLYVTTSDNEPSQRVARRLGFRLLTTTHVYQRDHP